MESEIQKEDKAVIRFQFLPRYEGGTATNMVEKADASGKKRMYVEGIASGPKLDAHEERMTDRAIKSFMDQANSGTILLYPDVHGIRASQDIGILTKAETIPTTGEWETEFRLYDDDDDVDQYSRDIAKKTWKQLAGLPPYNAPLQKGFSIEGHIPPDGILSAEKDEAGNIGKRVIDNVLLDGVIICPRPAYTPSIARAVYKSLGEIFPEKSAKVRKSIASALRDKMQTEQIRDQYFKKRWDVQSAMDGQIEAIMRKPDADKFQQMEILFDEYKQIMMELLKNSESLFEETGDDEANDAPVGLIGVTKAALSELERYRAIQKSLLEFKKIHNF